MNWTLSEIKKQVRISFEGSLDLKAELLRRQPEILDVSEIAVKGSVSSEGKFYQLDFKASYTIVLPSSRSLKPVSTDKVLEVNETYISAADALSEEEKNEFVMVLEHDELSLDEAVADNILLEIPSRILTADEEKEDAVLPTGKDWQVISEETYQKEKKVKDNPFSKLSDVFSEN